jgi:hypothetical protein
LSRNAKAFAVSTPQAFAVSTPQAFAVSTLQAFAVSTPQAFAVSTPQAFASFSPGLEQPWGKAHHTDINDIFVLLRPRVEATLGWNLPTPSAFLHC